MSEVERLESYSSAYQSAQPHPVWEVYKQASVAALRNWLKGRRALEVGIGTGNWSKLLAESFERLTIVEGSKALVQQRRESFPRRVEWQCGLFEEFESDEPFDFISLSLILEHALDPLTLLGKAGTLLAPGGRILILVPNARSIDRRINRLRGRSSSEFELNDRDLCVGHRRAYSEETLRADVERVGLHVDHLGGIGLKPLPDDELALLPRETISALADLGGELPADLCYQIYAIASVPPWNGAVVPCK